MKAVHREPRKGDIAVLARRHQQGAAPARLPPLGSDHGRPAKDSRLVRRQSRACHGGTKGSAWLKFWSVPKLKTAAEQKLATVAVVGLGYVGLPVAVAFGKQRPTIGYDLSKKRIENLRHHVDSTGEVATADLLESKQFRATYYPAELAEADFIIVAVPTPINAARQPDLSPLESRERDGRPLHEAGRDRGL